MDFSLDFSGLADIARDLETLSRAENNKVLRDATRAGAEVMRDAVVERAPERTGNSDNSMKASDPRNAFYWRFVELGTINMPAHPFIRPAFDTTEELAAQVAIQRMNQAIDEVLSK